MRRSAHDDGQAADGGEQREDLRHSIANVSCNAVVLGTPVNLALLMKIAQPVARVSMQAVDALLPPLAAIVMERLAG